jgi:methyltransferase (TIGR00027 family)
MDAGNYVDVETTLPNISDTARWVAVYRALESERKDALFRDPFAARLAGERGRQIAGRMPSAVRRQSWPMVVRTLLVDELVLKSVQEGADRVLNLAAGLDTRPFRLPLPASLLWVEADLPEILEQKERALASEKPVCTLRREAVDLTNPSARSAFLDEALKGSKRTLVVTEGLLIYLEPVEVGALRRDLAARTAIAWWVLDVASPAILKMMQRRTGPQLGPSAQMKFGPAEGVRFFEALGWGPLEIRSLFREAARVNRLPPFLRLFSWLPDPDPRNPGRRPWAAVVRCAPRPSAGAAASEFR